MAHAETSAEGRQSSAKNVSSTVFRPWGIPRQDAHIPVCQFFTASDFELEQFHQELIAQLVLKTLSSEFSMLQSMHEVLHGLRNWGVLPEDWDAPDPPDWSRFQPPPRQSRALPANK